MSNRKSGRPPAVKPRDFQIAVRLSADEYEKVRAAADKEALSISSYARAMLLKIVAKR